MGHFVQALRRRLIQNGSIAIAVRNATTKGARPPLPAIAITRKAAGLRSASRMKKQTIAIELTKLVAAQTRPAPDRDFFHLATDYLSVYRYILADLNKEE
ncbi:MAG: hypothetical protein WB615_03765 [Candidatus Tumulicola sp.]